MNDRPITAAEVQASQTRFMGELSSLIREARRTALSDALNGTPQDRFNYAITRASSRSMQDLMACGTVMVDHEASAKRAIRIFYRLELAAARRSA